MLDVRLFPSLKPLIENHVKVLLADHQSAIWETPHHPEAYRGNTEKILNALIEAGVITMGRHQIPCNIPTFHIARGPNFQEWRKQHEE